jgi:hypothetical protein
LLSLPCFFFFLQHLPVYHLFVIVFVTSPFPLERELQRTSTFVCFVH